MLTPFDRSVVDAFVSIFTELKGRYCADSFSFKGAHVYLTIVNFIALSLIISTLFTYLAVYKDEWKRARISAHGFFWCVKGPIMINFYIGSLLLSGLAYKGVLHGTDGSHSSDGLAWSAEAVRNGLEVIIGKCLEKGVGTAFGYENFTHPLLLWQRLCGDDSVYGFDDHLLWTKGLD